MDRKITEKKGRGDGMLCQAHVISCERSLILDNVRRLVGWSVGWSVCQQKVSTIVKTR